MTEERPHSAYAIYRTPLQLSQGMERLEGEGFTHSQLSIMFSSQRGVHAFRMRRTNRAAEGFTYGACAGLLGGGLLGWFAGAGSLELPGLGLLLVASGPALGMLAAAGAAALLLGVVGAGIGALLSLTVLERDTEQDAGLLLLVGCFDAEECRHARATLARTGATFISAEGESPRTLPEIRV